MTDDLNNISTGLTDNGLVALVFNKKVDNLIMPWQKADELIRALSHWARKAEEIAKANQIIADNALMQRSGAVPGVGLSDHPKICDETIKSALNDRNLRRWFPWRRPRVVDAIEAIQSEGVVGAPRLTQTPATTGAASNGRAK